MTEKMTNYKALVWVLDNCKNLPENVKDKVQAMAFQQAQKAASAKNRQSEKHKEAEVFQKQMLSFLQENAGIAFTGLELTKAIPTFANFGGQRVSSFAKALIEQEEICKTKKNKLVAYYVGELVEVEA